MIPQHLYIHWPFCRRKCSYCDFASFANQEKQMHSYHEALCLEIKEFAKTCSQPPHIKTIFLGGGTPSLYPLTLLTDLFQKLHEHFSLDSFPEQDNPEITIEANPGDVTQKHLATWKSLGINRLSIGVQMLDEAILQRVGRIQKNKDVHDLLALAPSYIKNISVDLILGLPGATTKKWFDSLNQLTSYPVNNLPINHVSIYFLTLYEKTPLTRMVKAGEIVLPSDDWLVETYEQTIDFLKKQGLHQYELSNFSRPGKESIHNQAYWDRKPYRGFGLSASSFDGEKRFTNTKTLIHYIDFWTKNECSIPYQNEETLNQEDIVLEELMLGLRQSKGVGLRRMLYFFNRGKREPLKQIIADLKNKNLISEKNGSLFLTVRGMVLENEILLKLLQ